MKLIYHYSGEKRWYELKAGMKIGRALDNNIIISHKFVSKKHAEIYQAEDGLHIKDSGSKNGIRVNEKDVSDCLLKAGDKITFGKAVVARIEA